MAYDAGLAERISDYLIEHPEFRDKKMFGGICFMVLGHMCCGVMGDKLMIRVPRESYDDYLAESNVSEMAFTGRPLKGFLLVTATGLSEDQDLARWLDISLSLVASLPPKPEASAIAKQIGPKARRSSQRKQQDKA